MPLLCSEPCHCSSLPALCHLRRWAQAARLFSMSIRWDKYLSFQLFYFVVSLCHLWFWKYPSPGQGFCFLWFPKLPLLSSRLQKTLMHTCASDPCPVQFCSSMRITAWSPLETHQWPPLTGRSFMKACSTSWGITIACTSLIQSSLPRCSQYCKLRFSRTPCMTKIQLLPTKKPLPRGGPSLSDWLLISLTKKTTQFESQAHVSHVFAEVLHWICYCLRKTRVNDMFVSVKYSKQQLEVFCCVFIILVFTLFE